jgi:hypothetical protein
MASFFFSCHEVFFFFAKGGILQRLHRLMNIAFYCFVKDFFSPVINCCVEVCNNNNFVPFVLSVPKRLWGFREI